MNRSKSSMSRQTEKKMRKEVKLGQLVPQIDESLVLKDENIAGRKIPKVPKKMSPKDKKFLINSLNKNRPAKLPITSRKHSKRTTPGEVQSRDAEPHYAHIEGRRWIKTLTKQSLEKKNLLNKKLSKKQTRVR